MNFYPEKRHRVNTLASTQTRVFQSPHDFADERGVFISVHPDLPDLFCSASILLAFIDYALLSITRFYRLRAFIDYALLSITRFYRLRIFIHYAFLFITRARRSHYIIPFHTY
ncbi:hypothetical protein Cal7507_4018 [Calothrix sp. PCC 7507]|nr:hypothetical protein Cal7507_4018 [Calothrix sp. PCC 7507]